MAQLWPFVFVSFFCAVTASAGPSCTGALKPGADSFTEMARQWDPSRSVPDFSQARLRDILPAVRRSYGLAVVKLREIAENPEPPTFANTIERLEFLTDNNLAESYFSFVYPTRQTRYTAKLSVQLSILHAEFLQDHLLANQGLFQRLQVLYNERNQRPYTDEQREIVENYYRFFVESGALFTAEQRAELQKLQRRLNEQRMQFEANNQDYQQQMYLQVPREALAEISADLREASVREAEALGLQGAVIRPTAPMLSEVLLNVTDRELRRKVYELNMLQGHSNRYNNHPIAAEIVTLRQQIAKIYGFANAAEKSLQDKSAPSVATVFDFLTGLATELRPRAEAEIQELFHFAKEQGFSGDKLMPWDQNFYLRKFKASQFAIDSQFLREHLVWDRVFATMLGVVERLYALQIHWRADLKSYHPDVKVYEVKRAGRSIGFLTVDPFARKYKKTGAWANSFYAGHTALDGNRVLGYGGINLNLQKGKQADKSLMTLGEVVTLYHEMGHFLDFILSRAQYPSMAGFIRPWDMVELPSQFFEGFALQAEILHEMARHHKTGEALPESYLRNIKKADEMFAANHYLRQASLAILDLKIYTEGLPKDVDLLALENRYTAGVRLDEALFPMSGRFSHIFTGGYSAGYYSYLWAEVYAKAAFDKFVKRGLFDSDLAKKFEDNLLAPGKTKKIVELFHRFHPEPVKPSF